MSSEVKNTIFICFLLRVHRFKFYGQFERISLTLE